MSFFENEIKQQCARNESCGNKSRIQYVLGSVDQCID